MMMMLIPNWNAVALFIVVAVQLRAITAAPTFVKVDAANNIAGRVVDISSNGIMMIVGSPVATVYQRRNVKSAWKQIGPALNSTGPTNANYGGVSVAMSSSDGTVVAVCGSQTVDVYRLNKVSSTSTWVMLGATLVSDILYTEAPLDQVIADFSADGSTIVIGRNGEFRLDGGEVTVYKFSARSKQWVQVGSSLTGTRQYDFFGNDVAISSDGTTVAVTTYYYDICGSTYPTDSRVKVYKFDSSVTEWKQVGSDILVSDVFFDQSAISLSADGSTIIIGAVGNYFGGCRSGSVEVYKFSTLTNQWERIFYKSAQPLDKLGSAVDISSDGKVIAFGSRPNNDYGQVRINIYRFNMTSSTYEEVFPNYEYCEFSNDTSPCSFGGSALALSGDGKTFVFGTNNANYQPNGMLTYTLDNGVVISPMRPPTKVPTTAPTKSPIRSVNNYFTVIDAKTDNTLGLLKTSLPGLPSTIDYSMLNTSSVSIESIFTSPNISVVQSVRMTLDSPPRTVCRNKKPYTLFGDVRGDIIGSPLTLGRRLVNATAYNGRNCTGRRVGTLSQSFLVKGCKNVQFMLFDAKLDILIAYVTNPTVITRPPCNVSIGVTFECGFQPDNVVINLKPQKTSTKSISTTLTRKEKNTPYFLFGDNGRGNIYSGTIPSGIYFLNIEIDGIIHPTVQLTLADSCY